VTGRLIEVSDLTKRYGATVALDGLSFTVRLGLVTGSSGLTARAIPI
jgi:ABC-2 type transport system ATP-binding protein